MPLIFGFDIGTTSIGFAVIDHDPQRATGTIRRMGVRIFPEARDPKHIPLNQQRRAARMRRRQLRRRRERRRALGDILLEAGLLPVRGSDAWQCLMKTDPYELRRRASAGEPLTAHEVGRALYHLAQRRHFKGRDIDEISDDASPEGDETDEKKARPSQKQAGQVSKGGGEDADEKKAKAARKETEQALKRTGQTLGAWLAERGPHERKRNTHATRTIVGKEFESIWEAQEKHVLALCKSGMKEAIQEAVFTQRPTFWRKKTLGECRLFPGVPPCPKGSWLSQQRRMLEKLNNLEIAGGNERPLDAEERAAILDRLQVQASMSWSGVKAALKPLYKTRGESGRERRLRFNLQEGGEKALLGNAVEAKLAKIFGSDWSGHPLKQEIRDTVPTRLRIADYGEIGDRVVIRPAKERRASREAAAWEFVRDFDTTETQARDLAALKLPTGWEPYSVEALQALLPHLEAGERFGTLLNSLKSEWVDWRDRTFPNREGPTGEVLDRLPSPAHSEERKRMAALRNPTVARTRNELRKVVNNLIDMFGKPDLIRVELTRDVGRSKRDREEYSAAIRKQEARRRKAREHLEESKFANPSRRHIEKWLLWQECGKQCPYTGDLICFDDLFGPSRRFDVEHIWPRFRSLDNGYGNKTLCRVDENEKKGNQTPYEYLHKDTDRWAAMLERLEGMAKSGMSRHKVKRFTAKEIPEGFSERQLNDTGYAAREAVAFLNRLWPDVGSETPMTVQAVSGRVTEYLRRLWGLNGILSKDGDKTRSDHRHHAVDALVVACTHPGMTNRLSRYWQAKDDFRTPDPPPLPRPWPSIRDDADRSVHEIVVSHRVRRKLSGPLHKETIYGDTGVDETAKKDGTTYRYFVTRKKVEDLTISEKEQSNGSRVIDIVDSGVQGIVRKWIEDHGENPKRAFVSGYPKRGRKGPEIRKVRVRKKQQITLMTLASTGYADRANNHHMAIYRKSDGRPDRQVVSLIEASQRLAKGLAVVQRDREDGSTFMMSLAPGNIVELQGGKEAGMWVVHGIKSSGRPVLARVTDARPTTATEASRLQMDGKRENFEPRFGGFMKRSPKKISVDPIGRIRPAND